MNSLLATVQYQQSGKERYDPRSKHLDLLARLRGSEKYKPIIMQEADEQTNLPICFDFFYN
jgi:hypothetical protein